MNKELREINNIVDLLSKYKVVIPKLQRGYAQGRVKDGKLLGNGFIDYLLKKIKEKEKSIKIDFIYVYTRNDDNNKSVLYPFDGQQRLTTLWLMKIYQIVRTKNYDCEYIKNFTYENRDSSKQFCHEISKMENIKELDFKNDIPSVAIREARWYLNSWNLDPTVQGMLNMLNLIAEVDKKNNAPIKTLDFSKINFIIYETKNSDDDLYIKMNSRGKNLNSFENFKADIYNYIYENNNREYCKFTEDFEYKWADIFWNQVKNIKNVDDKSEKADSLFYLFINRFFYMLLLKNKVYNEKGWKKDEGLKPSFLYGNIEEKGKSKSYNDMMIKYTSFDDYKKIIEENDNSGNEDLTFKEAFEIILNKFHDSKKIEDIKKYIPEWAQDNYNTGKFIIPQYISSDDETPSDEKLSNRERLRVYSIYLYYINRDDDKLLKDWLRIIWNITENDAFNSTDDMLKIFEYIVNLCKGLKSKIDEIEDFYKIIIDDYENKKNKGLMDEIQKLKWLLYAKVKGGEKIEKLINDLENIKTFKGNVALVLSKYDNKINDWYNRFSEEGSKTLKNDTEIFSELKKDYDIAKKVFDNSYGFNNAIVKDFSIYEYMLLDNSVKDANYNKFELVINSYNEDARKRLKFIDCISNYNIFNDIFANIKEINNKKFENYIKEKNDELIKKCGKVKRYKWLYKICNEKRLKDRLFEILHSGWSGSKEVKNNANKIVVRKRNAELKIGKKYYNLNDNKFVDTILADNKNLQNRNYKSPSKKKNIKQKDKKQTNSVKRKLKKNKKGKKSIKSRKNKIKKRKNNKYKTT